jgi:hypothetical protein
MAKLKGIKPRSVILNGYTWQIYWSIKSPGPDHGECDTDNKIITVYSSSVQCMISTLIHEIEHAIGENIWGLIPKLNMPDHDEIEETAVRLFEPRRLEFLTKNRELIEFIWANYEDEPEGKRK